MREREEKKYIEREKKKETVARLIHRPCPSVSVHPPLSGIPSSLSSQEFIIMIIIAPLIFYHSVLSLSFLSQGALEKYLNRRTTYEVF